jgi:C-terminal processing protease CtpA/Prc
LLEIDIVKRSIGICFCLEGGKDSPYGDGPIKVKRIFHGTSDFSAGKERLQPGDELVSVNGKDLTTATHYTAWTFLRSLPEGIMQFVVRRKLSS